MNSESIAGYALLSGLDKKPISMLRVKLPRSIYKQGVQSVSYLMHLILIASIAFSIVILLTLEYFAFSRLAKLTKQVESIDGAVSVSRVDIPGKDELSQLAIQINRMLTTLENSSRKLRESEEKLRLYNENLENTVLERTQQIEHLAFHDALTMLPNRALFMNRLEFAWARGLRSKLPLAVIFIDLDNFKCVNDTLGHEAGDQLLLGIADRLKGCLRLGDTVARLGGDEFTILIEEAVNPEDAIGIAECIIEAFASPFHVGTREIFASASIGVAFHTATHEEASDILLRNADAAMYAAKANGKSDFVLFDASIADHAMERMELETDLRFALERNELSLAYQPLISLDSRNMVGVEALLRWNHPTLGSISPSKFIPIAEDTGLILPIGYWVLEQACAQTQTWHDNYPEFGAFTMNINISGKQLQRTDVVSKVQEILSSTRVDPSSIKLEITESVMMTDLEVTIQRLHDLKALGVKLAMDDFGTGYSCMANIDTFPLDTIKIDRAFISRLTSMCDKSGQMVEAIIAISKALKLDVTGEGVETSDQLELLKRLGCDIAQGYFYSKPLSAIALEEIIAEGSASLAARCELAARTLPEVLQLAA